MSQDYVSSANIGGHNPSRRFLSLGLNGNWVGVF